VTAEIVVAPDEDALAWEAAGRVAAHAAAAVRQRGRFTLALSGGSTPLRWSRLLALAEWVVRVPWGQADIFWADERCVPPDHPDSNYGAARAALLDRLPLESEHIHRWYGEASDLHGEAIRYAAELRAHCDVTAAGVPRLDMVLLGMGTDGHTASLFPRSPALAITDRPAAANHVQPLDADRLTLTYPALNAAGSVVFLVAGVGKAGTLAAVLEGPARPRDLPAQGVRPDAGSLLWLVDAAAAAGLARTRHA
jgi:6-phosphogluconolactonase